MASATMTAVDSALKILYPDSAYRRIAYKNHPLLAMVPKNKNFVGKSVEFPIRYGGNQGRSRTLANAQAQKTAGLYTGFFLTSVKDYAETDIDTEVILASASNQGAFVNLLKEEIDGMLRAMSNNLATSLYRNSGGARGQVSAVGGGQLTLTNPGDVVNFEVGMELVNSTTDGTSGAVGSADQVITKVDRRAGKITPAATTNFSANDFLFVKGDFGISVSGLPAWVPNATPAATAFFGVDRTVDTRLYGQYVDGSSMTISEAFELADTIIAREGGKASHIFANPIDINRWRVSLESQVIYDKVKSPDEVSVAFQSIVLQGMGGPIMVVSDPDCPQGLAYMLTLDEWELLSRKEPVHIFDEDGLRVLRGASTDGVTARGVSYVQLGCHAPVWNAQILLP